MAIVHCGHCGTQNPAANTFCSSCGARLADGVASAASVQGKPAKKKASARQTGCGCLLLLVIAVVVIAAVANSGTTNQQATAPAANATPAATETPATTDTPAPPPSPTETLAQFAASASGDTYRTVADHPDAHQGDTVVWTCNIQKFLGADPNTSLNTDIGCWEYTGTYDGGTGDGEVILNVPFSVDTSTMDAGDDLTVYGTVDQPMQGTNAYGGTITNPQVDVTNLVDNGHDPNATQ